MAIELEHRAFFGVCDGCDSRLLLQSKTPNGARRELRGRGWMRVEYLDGGRKPAYLWCCTGCLPGNIRGLAKRKNENARRTAQRP